MQKRAKVLKIHSQKTDYVFFSKRQALSRAVVVNSNISRGKYLARGRAWFEARSGADPLTDRVTEEKRPNTSVSTREQSKKHPTHAQANICRRAEQPQWNRDDADEDEDDQLWTLVAGKKPTGKKAVIYVGNLKVGAKANEVAEYCNPLLFR